MIISLKKITIFQAITYLFKIFIFKKIILSLIDIKDSNRLSRWFKAIKKLFIFFSLFSTLYNFKLF